MVFFRKTKERQMIAKIKWALDLCVGDNMTQRRADIELAKFTRFITMMSDEQFRNYWRIRER